MVVLTVVTLLSNCKLSSSKELFPTAHTSNRNWAGLRLAKELAPPSSPCNAGGNRNENGIEGICRLPLDTNRSLRDYRLIREKRTRNG